MRLFTVTTNLKVAVLNLRRGAARQRTGRLQLSDVDSARMCLRVDQGKGNKDRYVPLSPRLLERCGTVAPRGARVRATLIRTRLFQYMHDAHGDGLVCESLCQSWTPGAGQGS